MDTRDSGIGLLTIKEFEQLSDDGWCGADVLPGFRCKVSELFGR